MTRDEIGLLVFAKTNGHCFYCGRALDATWERDHSTPRAQGGKYNPANLVPCCKGCNRSKSHRNSEEFKQFTKNKLLQSVGTARAVFERLPLAFSDTDQVAISAALSELSRVVSTAQVTWYGERQ